MSSLLVGLNMSGPNLMPERGRSMTISHGTSKRSYSPDTSGINKR